MQAAEDFLDVVLDAHITVAANSLIEPNITLEELSKKVVDKYVRFSTTCNSDTDDGVHTYTCEVMTLGLLWRNYYDSVREGDGKRVLSIWKYLLLILMLEKEVITLKNSYLAAPISFYILR